jgi:pyruvate carboxylase subunit B
VLIYALYPTTGMRFLRWKYGLETPPPEVKPKTIEDIKREDELIAKAKAGKLTEQPVPPKGTGIRVKAVEGAPVPGQVVEPPPAKEKAPPLPSETEAPPPPAEVKAGEGAIVAPMPGIIIRYEVEVGDEVKVGDTIVILEAMKMDNTIPTPISGRVKAIYFKTGDHIDRDDVLAVIG